MSQRIWLPLILLCGCIPGALSAQASRSEAARADFRAAWAGIGGADPVADSDALRAYLLYPYLQAARLRHALGTLGRDVRDAALEERVRAFLKSHSGQPVTWDLERAWLAYLAERRDWAAFVESAPETINDTALRCHRFSARIALDDLDGLREAILELWQSPNGRSSACDEPFRWLDTRERLSDDDIEGRARVAAMNRMPLPTTLAELPPERQALFRVWDRLAAQPARNLERFLGGENLLAPDRMPEVAPEDFAEALLETFDGLARRSSDAAGRIFEALHEFDGFTDGQRGRLRRSYALGLAYDHDPEAIEQFADVPDEALDLLAREWRVRSALFHAEWRRALRWLEEMPEAQRTEPRWLYWRARLQELRRDRGEAKALYEEAAKEREYYAFLAAERLGRVPELRPAALPADGATLDLLASTPGMLRALELWRVEMADLAMSEFRHVLRDLPEGARAQAVRLADAWGWHHAAILLLSELQLWDDLWLRFPLPYGDAVEAAAKDADLPADRIFALIRTESLFNPRAVSSANAQGLMQLRLATARQVAARAKRPVPSWDDLFDPGVNVALGTRYLREMLERFDGRLLLALAAYNAGPHRVPGWLPDFPVEGDVWVENIPYNETRNYVQRALSTLVVTGWRLNGRPTPILPLLPVLEPAGKDGGS